MSDIAKTSTGLTDRQKRMADLWVTAKVNGAEITYAEMAKAAGYKGTREVLDISATRCLRTPAVAAYLKQRAIEEQNADALDVVLELRALRKKAASEAVRKDILLDQAKGMGLLDQGGGASGPAIAVQISLTDPIAGAQMAQLLAMAGKREAIQGVAAIEHSPTEGEAARKAPRRPAKRTPPPGQAQDGQAPPGVKKPARKSPSRPPARLPSEKLRGENSGGSDG
jgi:hypothetical protein